MAETVVMDAAFPADAALTEYVDKCEKAYHKKRTATQGQVGIVIPWGQIITIFVQMLQGMCPTPPASKTIKAGAASPTMSTNLMASAAVRRALREQYGAFAFTRYGGSDMAAAMVEATATTDEAKIDAIMACCG